MKPSRVPPPDAPLLEQRPPAAASDDRSPADIPLSLMSSKIRDWHRQRKAVVYIRQSTPQQVMEHRESADRQYALVQRAFSLGWSKDRVEVIDEDQGHSGRHVEGRLGFQHLLAEIGLDHVGIISVMPNLPRYRPRSSNAFAPSPARFPCCGRPKVRRPPIASASSAS